MLSTGIGIGMIVGIGISISDTSDGSVNIRNSVGFGVSNGASSRTSLNLSLHPRRANAWRGFLFIYTRTLFQHLHPITKCGILSVEVQNGLHLFFEKREEKRK